MSRDSSTQILFDAFKTGEPQLIEIMYGPVLGRPLDLISDSVRGFIWAAPGHDLIQADYSSIEGCVIAWTSNEEWKLRAMEEIFADPKNVPDMYRRTAAGIMNLPLEIVTKKHPFRQTVGKVSELACFGPQTPVLTNNGVKPISRVSRNDKLWDGVEWVTHQGVIGKGVRSVVDVAGIAVTPDHLLLTAQGWKEAGKLASDRSMLDQALAIGSENLPSLGLSTAPQAGSVSSFASALAVLNLTGSQSILCVAEPLRAATLARRRSVESRVRAISHMMTSYLIRLTVNGCSIVSQLALTVVLTPRIKATPITAGEALPYFGDGIDERISNISSRLKAGIIRNWNWIASKSIAVMNPATFGSLRERSTLEIDEKCKPSKHDSTPFNARIPNFENVYDIVNAGPRNRFLVFSNRGPLIAHNCGFGGGVGAFAAMARNGGVDLNPIAAPVIASASPEALEKAIKRYESNFKRNKSSARDLERDVWIACELIKVGWRKTNPKIADGWTKRENAIRDAIRAPGTVISWSNLRYTVWHGYLFCQLPSGRCLAYASPKLRDQVWAKILCDDGTFSEPEVFDRETAEKMALQGKAQIQGDTSPSISVLGLDKSGKRMRRETLYSGLIAENDTQGIARDVLVSGMLKAEAAGYEIIGHVYDEMFAEVRRGWGDVAEFERLICVKEPWMEGLPLMASGWRGKRYRK